MSFAAGRNFLGKRNRTRPTANHRVIRVATVGSAMDSGTAVALGGSGGYGGGLYGGLPPPTPMPMITEQPLNAVDVWKEKSKQLGLHRESEMRQYLKRGRQNASSVLKLTWCTFNICLYTTL